MRGNILGLLAVALTCVCGVARSTPIVYNVDFTDGTETVTGTIATDGVIGALAAWDITTWNLTATGPVAFSIVGNGVNCGPGGCGISATVATLVYDFLAPTENVGFMASPTAELFLHNGDVFVDAIQCCAYHMFSDPSPIATVSVPEPATATLLGLALAGLGFARKRSRGRQSTAVQSS